MPGTTITEMRQDVDQSALVRKIRRAIAFMGRIDEVELPEQVTTEDHACPGGNRNREQRRGEAQEDKRQDIDQHAQPDSGNGPNLARQRPDHHNEQEADIQLHLQHRRRHLSAHYRGGVRTVPIENILYLLAEQKYVTVRHQKGRMLVDESLKALELEFPDRFMRIHRNALVASARLVGLERAADGGYLAVLQDCEERLAVSRRHLPDVRRFLR